MNTCSHHTRFTSATRTVNDVLPIKILIRYYRNFFSCFPFFPFTTPGGDSKCGICLFCETPKKDWIDGNVLSKARPRTFASQCVSNHKDPRLLIPALSSPLSATPLTFNSLSRSRALAQSKQHISRIPGTSQGTRTSAIRVYGT